MFNRLPSAKSMEELMSQPDDVELEIIQTTMRVGDQGQQERWPQERLWTQNLISALGQLGYSKQYHVCGRGCRDYGQGEWLYDLVWLKNVDNFIVDVPLILESEWSHRYTDISEDFGKLLVGRAQHRVMIFQQNNVDAIFRRLTEEVRNFSLTQVGDRYLFLGLNWPGGTFKYEVFVA
jgi:hypothetical protein